MAPVIRERKGGFVDPQVMFPCSVPPPNNLRAGDVVRHIDDDTVGVVTSSPTSSWGDIQICTSSAVSTITNNSHRCWQVIPHRVRTYKQRVGSAAASIEWSRTDDPPEWCLLSALLDDEEFEALSPDSEWPSTTDLALAVAAKLDRRTGSSDPPVTA